MWNNTTENNDATFRTATKNHFGILLDILRTEIIPINKLHSSQMPFYFKHFTVLHEPLLHKVMHLVTFTSCVWRTKTYTSFFCEPFGDKVHCFTRIRRGSDLWLSGTWFLFVPRLKLSPVFSCSTMTHWISYFGSQRQARWETLHLGCWWAFCNIN